MLDHETRQQLLRFGVVGAVGFLVDATVLTVLVVHLEIHPYPARAASFTVAVLCTWLVNRRWTFARRRVLRAGVEYLRYLLVQIAGALANLAIFVLALQAYPALIQRPVIPLAVGAVAGLIVNFLGARAWVFPRRQAERGERARAPLGG